MRSLVVLALVLAAAVCQAQEPRLHVHTQKQGRLVITNIQNGSAAAPSAPQAVALEANTWRCGREFTDGVGRRWKLVSGAPHSEKPPQIGGWLLPTREARQFFLTVGGRLFLRVA